MNTLLTPSVARRIIRHHLGIMFELISPRRSISGKWEIGRYEKQGWRLVPVMPCWHGDTLVEVMGYAVPCWREIAEEIGVL
jgi:hypothetical protein